MDRAAFLTSAGAALVVAVAPRVPARAGTAASTFAPNAWLTIDPQDRITIFVSRSEMGQGVATSMPMLVAEELEVPLARVKVAFAPAAPAYFDAGFGEQATGGSTSVKSSFEPLRRAGAQARTMLLGAAAARWNVPVGELTASGGTVVHASSGRRATYGELALDAAAQPVPSDVALKPPSAWTLIGTRVPRVDVAAKSTGKAIYGIDVRLPGMLIATVAKPPSVSGGRVLSYDAGAARKVPGVHAVVPISSGIAVVADHYYAAQQGKAALNARFVRGNPKLTSAAMFREMNALAKQPGLVGNHTGDPDTALAGGKTLRATYTAPFLAHATMEPMNATAVVHDDRCEVWAPTQVQTRSQQTAMKITGLPADRVTVHTTYLGGGFGRRLDADYVADAVEIAKAVRRPIKVVWSRENDIQHDFYRPASVTALAASLGTNGTITAMTQRLVSGSVAARWAPPILQGQYDATMGSNTEKLHYAIPNYRYEQQRYEPGIPIGWLRAPYANANAWVTESFIDELAHLAGQDPYAFRRAHLQSDARALAVLDAAAQLGRWSTPAAAGVHRGIALAEWEGALIATVADVAMHGSTPKVLRLASAVDVGTVVNPSTMEAQVRSAMIYGLSAAMTGKITFTDGAVDQHNFYDYDVVRMAGAPQMEVRLMASTLPPFGGGEIGTPPVAPAVCNAIFAATGKRIRTLPIADALA